MTGPGRLGRPLLGELQRRGVTGTVLHRQTDASLPPGWRFLCADVTRPESLVAACAGCDEVLHLAAVTHSNRPALYDEVNVGGTQNLLASAQRSGVRRFTLVSSRAISAAGGAYSRSKLRAEELVRESGLDWNILRPAEIYGAGGEGVSTLIERCRRGGWIPVIGDGSARLAPIYLDDAVDGICRAVLTSTHGDVLQLAGPEEMTYRELIARLAAYFHTSPRTLRVPAAVLTLVARGLSLLPLARPPLYVDQVPRLLSPKTHDVESARERLAFRARPLEAGLDAFLGPRHGDAA